MYINIYLILVVKCVLHFSEALSVSRQTENVFTVTLLIVPEHTRHQRNKMCT